MKFQMACLLLVMHHSAEAAGRRELPRTVSESQANNSKEKSSTEALSSRLKIRHLFPSNPVTQKRTPPVSASGSELSSMSKLQTMNTRRQLGSIPWNNPGPRVHAVPLKNRGQPINIVSPMNAGVPPITRGQALDEMTRLPSGDGFRNSIAPLQSGNRGHGPGISPGQWDHYSHENPAEPVQVTNYSPQLASNYPSDNYPQTPIYHPSDNYPQTPIYHPSDNYPQIPNYYPSYRCPQTRGRKCKKKKEKQH